jgi:peptidoglycan/LPS O-acetylase OafA/YrhL
MRSVLPAATVTTGKHTDMGIEGIRGIAAFFVALSHVFFSNILDPQTHLSPVVASLEAGHAGVLVFFVLSGYVISWTNSRAYSPAAVRQYVKRRCVRIYPIYLGAMLLTLVAIRTSGLYEPLRVLVGSLLCLQNFNGYFGLSLNPPRVNGPLWSLNYEFLYYALFLLLWRYRPRLTLVFLPALLAGILAWFAPRLMPLFIASYGCGWIFWASGWWLSAQPHLEEGTHDRTPLATWILLIFASHNINGIARACNALHFYSNDAGMVSIADLGLLPAILLAFAAVAHRRLPWRKGLMVAAWAVCLVPIAGMIATGRLSTHGNWIVGTWAVALAGLLAGWRSTRWLKPFAWFGGISYAFYVVHFPLLYLVKGRPLPPPTPAGFVARVAVWAAIAVALSWFLEKRFQPWIRRRLLGGRT